MNIINKRFLIKFCTVALFLVLPMLCRSAEAQQSEATAESVVYCDLVKAPQTFSARRIRVRAIYKYGFEIQQLDSPICCPGGGLKIWVEMGSKLQGKSLKLFRKFPKGMGLALATFVGTFESGGPYGDGRCHFKFTADQIEKLEHTAKASPNHNPVWVPQNCEKIDAAPAKRTTPTALHERAGGALIRKDLLIE